MEMKNQRNVNRSGYAHRMSEDEVPKKTLYGHQEVIEGEVDHDCRMRRKTSENQEQLAGRQSRIGISGARGGQGSGSERLREEEVDV